MLEYEFIVPQLLCVPLCLDIFSAQFLHCGSSFSFESKVNHVLLSVSGE